MDIDLSIAEWLGKRDVCIRCIKLDADATGEELERMGPSLRLLTNLNARGCTALKSGMFVALKKYCPFLKTLDLKDCTNLPDTAMLAMATALSSLKMLDLTDSCKGEIITIFPIISHCRGGLLTTLRLGGCTRVTDAMVADLCQGVTSLTDLDLGSSSVGDEGLRMIAGHLHRLRYFDVQCCNRITNAGVLHLTALRDSLWEVNFAHCHDLTDDCMVPLVSACHELRFYGISHCEQVTEQAIAALAQHNPSLTECDLSYTTIEGEELSHLAVTCPGLLHMNLAYCSHMSTESIVMLIKMCEGLLSLDLSANAQVTAAVTDELALRPSQLEELSLCHCSDAVTDECVLGIAVRCPALVALNLAYCTAVTDAAVLGLAIACPGLQYLDLSGCVAVTDAALEALQQHCAGLQSLELIQCKRVTVAAIDRMIEATEAAVTY